MLQHACIINAACTITTTLSTEATTEIPTVGKSCFIYYYTTELLMTARSQLAVQLELAAEENHTESIAIYVQSCMSYNNNIIDTNWFILIIDSSLEGTSLYKAIKLIVHCIIN